MPMPPGALALVSPEVVVAVGEGGTILRLGIAAFDGSTA
jgi:hypothetical protein